MRPDLGVLFGAPADTESDIPPEFRVPAEIVGGNGGPELCQLADRWTPELHPERAIGHLKVDGRRALYIGGQLVSREGIPMHQAAHSYRALVELERAFGKPMFFDGEYEHPEGLDAAGRPGGTIWLFDALPLEIWRVNGPSVPLEARIEQLLERGQDCFGPALGALKPFRCCRPGDAIARAHELWALGYEGIVVKSRDAPYDRRRSTRWLKLKRWRTEAFKIVDTVKTRAGHLASILILVDGRQQRVGSGPALTPTTRQVLADLIRPGDMALIEYAGKTSGGLLRDASFERMADG